MARKVITFSGWNGRWWTRVKVGRAVYDAAQWVLPLKLSLAIMAGEVLVKYVGGRRGSVR